MEQFLANFPSYEPSQLYIAQFFSIVIIIGITIIGNYIGGTNEERGKRMVTELFAAPLLALMNPYTGLIILLVIMAALSVTESYSKENKVEFELPYKWLRIYHFAAICVILIFSYFFL